MDPLNDSGSMGNITSLLTNTRELSKNKLHGTQSLTNDRFIYVNERKHQCKSRYLTLFYGYETARIRMKCRDYVFDIVHYDKI